MAQISTLPAMDRTTLTANPKRLERRGVIQVLTGDRDKRRRVMVLTPAGRPALAPAVPIWTRTHRIIAGCVGRGRGDRLDLVALS